MKKTIKKMLCAALSLTMVAGSIVLPTMANADETEETNATSYTPLVAGDTVLNEWKFDFGAADSTPEDGYTLVTPDRNYVTTKDYGFLGIDEESYKLGDRLDGFGNQQGQVIELEAGGGIGLDDGIGSVGQDIMGNAGDIYYPTRFALKVDDETYYRVKATVTTLDPEKDAEISLYTERKHPIFTDKKVDAGDTYTAEFTVRVTPIYYQKSTPTGAIADGMVNVCVLGENSAIASLEIQQIETAPTFWVLGDSTVTDGNCSLPFFRLQNYTGVGTGLTKYLPTTMAMVNEGEGGLNAADNYHFNMVSSRIKEGDYMYVEYGHNHKDDGASGYKTYLDKYYNVAHAAGAKLIIVSPIERINTWDADTNTYQHSLRDFATTGEAYVSEKIAAGADDIAYVDLNQYSLDFYNKIVADNGNDSGAIKFYFQTANGGSTDQTHPNDAGAENLAYEFFKAAKAVTDETQQAVLAGFLDEMTDETPNLVPTSITSLGAAPNSAWPNYTSPVSYPYPVVIEGVNFDENGALTSVDVKVQPSDIVMDSYGIIIVTVYNEDGTEKGKIYAKDQVDNSSGNGPQTIEHFTTGVTLGENDTYTAIVMKAKDAGGETGLIVDEDANLAYSATYKPTEIEKILIRNENKNGAEDFNYYGASYDGTSSLDSYNGWSKNGSAGITLTLGEDDDETKYATIKSDGAKNGTANQGSFYVAKDFSETVEENDTTKDVTVDIGTSGRYLVSADMKYVSGGGLVTRFVSGNTSSKPWGTATIDLFTVGSNGVVTAGGTEIGSISATDFTNVSYTLDMDAGKAYVSVGGSDEKEITVSNYATLSTDITPASLTAFLFGGDKVPFEMQVSNLTVAKLKDSGETTTLTVDAQTAEPTPAYSVKVTADKAYEKAALIVAQYNADKTLKDVSVTEKALAEGENTFDVEAEEGSTIMLWDGLETMKPFTVTATKKEAEPIVMGTVHIGDDTETVTTTTTVAQGSTVKAVAEPEDGYIFIKWVDADGTTISKESELDIHLYKDLDLTAQFAKQGGVEDTVSFDLSADKQFVKVGSGQTVAMTVSNVSDASGNPVKYSASDITWSCDDSNVTVENGVVALGSGFTLGDEASKTITITAKINNISKTYEILVNGADYFENFSSYTAGTTYVGVSGTNGILSNGSNPYSGLTVSAGGANGTGGNITPIATGNNFGYYSAGFNQDNYKLTFNPAKAITRMKFDAAFGAQTWAGGTPSARGTDAVTLTVGNLVITATPSNTDKTTSTALTDPLTVTITDGTNTKTATSTLKQLGWATYDITVGEENGVTVTITPAGGEAETITGLTLSADATSAVFSGSKTASFGIDNIELTWAE